MPELQLPADMQTLRPELGTIVAEIETHVPYAAIFLSAAQGMRITVENREERISEEPPVAGATLTAYDGATLHEAAVGGFDLTTIWDAARQLTNGLHHSSGPRIDPGPERRGDFDTPMVVSPDSLSTQEKLERVRQLHHKVKALDPHLANVRVNYAENSRMSVFRNREADLAQRTMRVSSFVLTVASREDGVRYAYDIKDGAGGWELLEFSDESLETLVKQTRDLFNAERIQPGEYQVVSSPGVTGVLMHESFGHGVETDMFVKQRARAAHFIDKAVGSPLVNIYDDPSYAGAPGFYAFDDEGWLSRPTAIVENGVFRRGITDMYSATALGISRSANGRRQDYSRKAYARMSNTFHTRGTTPVTELFDQVENGIYLEKWSSGMEDPQGWGIQVTCHYGHEIKRGKVTGHMFAPIGITGYVPDMLKSISAVGDDFKLDGGGCGKGHKEFVPVSSGGPHLLLRARLG
jgi:TldD protein